MPCIKIQTNVKVENSSDLLKKLSAVLATELGKPESYVMTILDPVEQITMGGNTDPAVFIECKSIGLKKDQTAGLSSVLCTFCSDELGVPGNRVYSHFVSVEGAMWGWNSGTF